MPALRAGRPAGAAWPLPVSAAIGCRNERQCSAGELADAGQGGGEAGERDREGLGLAVGLGPVTRRASAVFIASVATVGKLIGARQPAATQVV